MGTKARKIAQRTGIGAAIVAVLVGMLWWAEREGTGRVVLFAGSLLAIGCAYEVHRLGNLRGRGLFWILAPAILSITYISHLAIEGSLRTAGKVGLDRSYAEAYAYLSQPSWELLVVALLVVCWHGIFGLFRRNKPFGALTALPMVAIVVGIAYFAVRDGLEPADFSIQFLCAALLVPALLLILLAALVNMPMEPGAVGRSVAYGLWLVAPLPWLYQVWARFDQAGLVALVALSKVGDIFGYYFGNAMGKSHPFPGISPGKTTAGCVASLVGAIAVGGALSWFGVLPEGRWGLAGGLLAGGLINVAAQAGDLLESLVKRRAGVKDSGTWFGPAGGVLDLVDSLLLTVPVALLTWPWLFGEG